MSQHLVVVLGATGAQGGSVVEALLSEGKYKIRAVTRNPESDKAKQLSSKGVEVVAGDLFHTDSLNKAFQGAWAVFAVTNFWDPAQMGKEFELGKGIADVAKETKVEYLIWSSLPNADEISKGKYHVPHLTHKSQVEDYIKKIGLKGIFPAVAFYYQNFSTFFPPKKDEQGNLVISLPFPEDGMLTGIDVQETGLAVAGILKNPEQWVGKFIPLWGTHAPLSEYLKQFTEVNGKPVKFVQLPSNALGEELGHMFGFFADFYLYGKNQEEYEIQKKLGYHAKSFAEWLKVSGWGSNL
eukprot:CAMPEP_0168567258 /NCGR_PEP_ID=MMETSP0413-20121227/14904_1 /TAXON_ID=136452 /ORGANISM="Filamoeba nolandi, Strain NC-AS-23-1" /LENGTH=295 /DNA_ID=CAMNT_0008599427 /DNA_START=46 /DNA_END=933 /DNA_ORIENTATION=-